MKDLQRILLEGKLGRGGKGLHQSFVKEKQIPKKCEKKINSIKTFLPLFSKSCWNQGNVVTQLLYCSSSFLNVFHLELTNQISPLSAKSQRDPKICPARTKREKLESSVMSQ